MAWAGPVRGGAVGRRAGARAPAGPEAAPGPGPRSTGIRGRATDPDRPARPDDRLGRPPRPAGRRVRAGRGPRRGAARLDEVASALGSGLRLERLRRNYGEALGRSSSGTVAIEPRTAWEHCDLGRACLRDGELRAPTSTSGVPSISGRKTSGPTSIRAFARSSSAGSRSARCLPRLHLAGPASRRVLLQSGPDLRGAGRTSEALRDYTRARVRFAVCRRRAEPGRAPLSSGASLRGGRRLPPGTRNDLDGQGPRGHPLQQGGSVALARDDRAVALVEPRGCPGPRARAGTRTFRSLADASRPSGLAIAGQPLTERSGIRVRTRSGRRPLVIDEGATPPTPTRRNLGTTIHSNTRAPCAASWRRSPGGSTISPRSGSGIRNLLSDSITSSERPTRRHSRDSLKISVRVLTYCR